MLRPDVPIQTASDDVLGRHSFAEQLARAMINYNSPEAFTIGLYGPWGSGKTSVINLLEEELNKQSDDCIIVRFNPWLCSATDQMISQFFEQLKSDVRTLESKQSTPEAMRNFAEISKNICEAVGKYADALKWTRVIPGLNALGTIFEALGTGTEIYQKIVRDADKPQSLQDHKNRIQRILEEQKQKIIIIIDDLDRLSSDEIVAVFQLVKSLADFPYMIYLLAFDRDIVVKALEDVQKGNGNTYLEKIVQMPFELPRASSIDIEQVFFKRLEEIVQEQADPIWENTGRMLFDRGIQPYLLSLRDVTRYINAFALKYGMLKTEVDLQDLILLTCIQVFEPETFAQLPFYSDTLCGVRADLFVDEKAKKAKVQSIYDELLKPVSSNKKEAIGYLLGTLFPELRKYTQQFIVSTRYQNWEERMRHHCICCRECFDRYFALNLEHNAIPNAVIEYLVLKANQNDFIEQITKLTEAGKLDRFLHELEAYFEPYSKHVKIISEERACQLIVWLCEQWVEMEKIPNAFSFFLSSVRDVLLRIDFRLLEIMPSAMRCDILRTIIASPKVAIGAVWDVLWRLEQYHNRFVEETQVYNDTIITLDQLKELETAFMKRMLESLQSGQVMNDEDGRWAVWLAEKIDIERNGLTQMKAAIREHLSNDAFLAKLITIHVSGEAQLDHIVWNCDIDTLIQYMDLEEATVRVEHFLTSEAWQQVEEKNKRRLVAFLIAVDFKNNGEVRKVSDDMVDEKLNALAAH